MSLQVRPAQLKDLGAIEALYRQQVKEAERPPLKRQFASSRLWFLLNSTFASILPISSPAIAPCSAGRITLNSALRTPPFWTPIV